MKPRSMVSASPRDVRGDQRSNPRHFTAFSVDGILIDAYEDPVDAMQAAKRAGNGSYVQRADGVRLQTVVPLFIPEVDDTPRLIGVPVAVRISH